MRISVTVGPEELGSRPLWPDCVSIRYLTFGGLVLQMLSESHVAGLPYLSVSLNDPQYAGLSSVPVVTHILAGSPYSTDAATFGGIVKNLYDEHNNCYEVRTLEDVERFLRSCEPVVVEFVSGRRIGTSLALLSEFEKE